MSPPPEVATHVPVGGRRASIRELGVFAVVLVAAFAAGSIAHRAVGGTERAIRPVELLVQATVIGGVLLGWVWIIQRQRGGSLRDLGLSVPQRAWGRTLARGAVAGLVIKIATVVAVIPLVLVGAEPQPLPFVIRGGLDPVILLGSGCFAAVSEEVVFRGFLRTRVAVLIRDPDPRGSLWRTGLATSAVFGLLHVTQGVPGVAATGVAALLLFAWLRRNRYCLVDAIVAHAVFNVTAMLAVLATAT